MRHFFISGAPTCATLAKWRTHMRHFGKVFVYPYGIVSPRPTNPRGARIALHKKSGKNQLSPTLTPMEPVGDGFSTTLPNTRPIVSLHDHENVDRILLGRNSSTRQVLIDSASEFYERAGHGLPDRPF